MTPELLYLQRGENVRVIRGLQNNKQNKTETGDDGGGEGGGEGHTQF